MEETAVKKCSTCQRDIEVSKFRMHEIGCARNNYKCAICGEIVAKAEKDEHDKEQHVKVKCQYCSYETEKHKFGDHEQQCDLRPKPCKYCEQIVNFENYEKHIQYCGSKTKKCQVCNHNIMAKDQDAHDFGGECRMFIEEDKRKKIEEEERKRREEIKRKEEEEKRQREKEQKKKMSDQQFSEMIDIDDEFDSIGQKNNMVVHNVNPGVAISATKKKNLFDPQHNRVGRDNQEAGGVQNNSKQQQQQQQQQQQRNGLPSQNANNNHPLAPIQPKTQIKGTSNSQQKSSVPSSNSMNQQQVRNQSSQQQNRMSAQVQSNNNVNINNKQPKVAGGSTNSKNLIAEEVKSNQQKQGQVLFPKDQLFHNPPKHSAIPPSKGVSNNNQIPPKNQQVNRPGPSNTSASSSSQQNKIPQSKPFSNPPKQIQKPFLDKDVEIVSRVLEEDESEELARKLQEQFYAGERGGVQASKPVLDRNSNNNNRQQNSNIPPQHNLQNIQEYDQMIDSRGFRDQWEDFGQQVHGDEDYQKVIEESLKQARNHGFGSNIDDENLQKAIQQSLRDQ